MPEGPKTGKLLPKTGPGGALGSDAMGGTGMPSCVRGNCTASWRGRPENRGCRRAAVMWAETAAGAWRILHTPPGGIGGDLEICYALPRPDRLWDRRYGSD